MADIISSVASTALTSLGSSALQEVASVWNFKSELHRLTDTIRTIRDVLLAHDGGQVRGLENLIERLKDAVHDADDLLDKFTTIVERKRIMISSSHVRFTKEVQLFFSCDNQVATAFKISREIKRITKTLDNIVGDRQRFASMLPLKELAGQPRVAKRRETCSFIVAEDVIGREDDKKKIIDVLLRHDHRNDQRTSQVVVLPIVGVGGLGKTTIAQFVFNDEDVQNYFEIKEWVCIGDDLDAKDTIRRIVSCTANDLSLEHIHSKFREKMGGKKYLLILDDVWLEDPSELLRLRSLLSVGEKRSRVVVTTQSMFTAQRIGTIPPVNLQLLSDEASWILFANVAFGVGWQEQQQQEDQQLVQIGKKIAKKCGNLPLAIKVIAGLLQGKDEKEWQHFKDHDMSKIDIAGGIMPMLKMSYTRLPPQLKQCFIYCSLFPKDSKIKRTNLCHLWMAQGFITSSSGESLEDVAGKCFMELLNRSFFQDIQRDESGEIQSFKMHDLIHDLAKEVAGKEMLFLEVGGDQISLLTTGIRHLSIREAYSIPNLPCALHEEGKRLRTFIQLNSILINRPSWEVSDLISTFRYIKVLDLCMLGIEQLPDSIGTLIHLRYLDLSYSNFEALPRSFTRLHNLQTLNLLWCRILKELPRDLSKLVNLCNLDLTYCDDLAYMPPKMGNLTRLRRLTKFVVGMGKFSSTHCNFKQHAINASGFDDLFLLKNLRGSLKIVIDKKDVNNYMSMIRTSTGCLLNKSNLTELKIIILSAWNEADDGSQDEELLESLQPHSNIRELYLQGYGGQKFPSWMSRSDLGLILPNLVEIELRGCVRCKHVAILSQLPSLKSVRFGNMYDVEYIESDYSYEASTTSFFPSLRYLSLIGLPNVKGWWRHTVGSCDDQQQPGGQRLPSFPRLSELSMIDCPNMTNIPLCPFVERLHLCGFNENLHVIVTETEEWNSAAANPLSPSSSSTTIMSSSNPSLLSNLTIDNSNYLNHLPKPCLHTLTQLTVQGGKEGTLLPSGSILQHLTALEELQLSNCYAHDVDDEMYWRSLQRLRLLKFDNVRNLKILPKGLEYLTNLEDLEIQACENFVELPEWISQLGSSLRMLDVSRCRGLKALPGGIRDLTSLRELSLAWCDGLMERCRKFSGEDWPKIRHVPRIKLPDGKYYEQ